LSQRFSTGANMSKVRTTLGQTTSFFKFVAAITVCGVLSVWAFCEAAYANATIAVFDAPAAGTATGQGTNPESINASDSIAGYYIDSNDIYHGFVRTPDGAITSFDPSGSTATIAYSINMEGTVAGFYNDSQPVSHGFVRRPNGRIVVFDAVAGALETIPFSINDKGAIAGSYEDTNNVFHGFVRAHDGSITTFDVPGAASGVHEGTTARSINNSDAITGEYVDSNEHNHGFVRYADGTILTFDASDSTDAPVFGINRQGTITGWYLDGRNFFDGFVRSRDGTITSFDVPESRDTSALSINDKGEVTGVYDIGSNANSIQRCFIRTVDGKYTKFYATEAGPGGTAALSINNEGSVTGLFAEKMGSEWIIRIKRPSTFILSHLPEQAAFRARCRGTTEDFWHSLCRRGA
jgi:hypothetical protein